MPRLDDWRRTVRDLLGLDHGSPTRSVEGDGLSAPFEAIVRVALGLIAEARQASAAFDTLRDAGLLEPSALAEIEPLELDDLFRQARVRVVAKALKPLQRIARWASDVGFDAGVEPNLSTESIREAWRSLNGVGPATADSLLLHALRRATYPVDRATYRVLVRHGWLDPSSDYDEARSVAESIAPDDSETLDRLALALEKLGRDCCKPTVARCDRCVLRALLPESGPVEIS